MIARAERLGLVLAQLRGVPYLDVAEAFSMTPLTVFGELVVREVTNDDLALATSLINVEAERREAQYAALAALGSLVAWEVGTLEERVLELDGREFVCAVASLLTLGWLDRPDATQTC